MRDRVQKRVRVYAYLDGDGDLDVPAVGDPEALVHGAERAAADLPGAAQLALAHQHQLRHVRPRVGVLVQRLEVPADIAH